MTEGIDAEALLAPIIGEEEGEEDQSVVDMYTSDGEEVTREPPSIPADVKEQVDNKGHFKVVEVVEESKYPTRSDVFTKLCELDKDFSKTAGFSEIDIQNGLKYFFITEKYQQCLVEWMREDDGDPIDTDLAVDNERFCETGTKSKVSLTKLRDGVHVTEDIWNQLMEWFGGGPSISLVCRRGVLIPSRKLKIVRVVCSEDTSIYRRFIFNPNITLQTAKKEICEAFGVEPDNCRLHDFYKRKPFAQLDIEHNLGTKLEKRNLMPDNFILIEVADKDGGYLIEHRRGRSALPTKDTIGGRKGGMKGIVGLANIGNTCYMASTLQCLSAIAPLREQFLTKAYEGDLNLTNPLGYKGKVAKAFFNIMRLMWSRQGSVVTPHGFKRAISAAKTEFAGREQHDSQEFLSQLLDALHEDLNRVKNKPATDRVEKNNRADEEVAKESLDTHKLRNDSIVHDLFLGLYKSTVTCPGEDCNNISVTFDPYTIISLPLQVGQRAYQVVRIVFVPLSVKKLPEQVEVIIPKHGPLYLLRSIMKAQLGIDQSSDLMFCQLYSSRLQETPLVSTKQMNFTQTTKIVCYEVEDYMKYEFSLYEPDDSWERKLKLPRPLKKVKSTKSNKEDSDEEKEEEEEEEEEIESKGTTSMPEDLKPKDEDSEKSQVEKKKKVEEPFDALVVNEAEIGYQNCPFVRGDTWHGNYNYKDTKELVRIEVTSVKRLDWSAYSNYKEEVISKLGNQTDTELTEDAFNETEVFQVTALADTKEYSFYKKIYTKEYQSTFGLSGVYIVYPEIKQNKSRHSKKSIRKSKIFAKKRKSIDKEDIADTLTSGSLEKQFLHGHFVLRPTEIREKLIVNLKTTLMSYYKSLLAKDESRDPIILTGEVEKEFKLSWGKFRVEKAFTKGEFTMQRYESMHWHESLAQPKDAPIVNLTSFPVPSEADDRTLVMLCHRVDGRVGTMFTGIPDAFFVPKETAESDAVTILRGRMEEFVLLELAKAGQKRKQLSEITGKEEDVVTPFVKSIEYIRASERFSTSVIKKSDTLVGRKLDSESDMPFDLGDSKIVYLVIDWEEEYQFFETRSASKLFKKQERKQDIMTLKKALQLFTKKDRLSDMNYWYCNKCKELQEAYKQFQIWSLPQVLVIQFKRFSQDERRIRADKLEINVDFPFDLDLAEFSLTSKLHAEAGESLEADIDSTSKSLTPFDYELVAVSSHVGGGLGFGHYVACTKSEVDGRWYQFNDERVTKIGKNAFSRIVNPQAYVLFYVRKSIWEDRQEEIKVQREARDEERRKKQQTGAEVEVAEENAAATE